MAGLEMVVYRPLEDPPIFALKIYHKEVKKAGLKFLETIETSNKYLYREIVNLMRKFNLEGVESINALKHKVKKLFESRDRPDLILGFNAFLPLKHRFVIKLPIRDEGKNNVKKLPRVVFPQKRKRKLARYDDDEDNDVRGGEIKLQKVIDFVNKVYERFHKEKGEDAFKLFLESFLGTNQSKRIKLPHNEGNYTSRREELRVFNKVKKLLDGHPDLVNELMEFSPAVKTSYRSPSLKTTRKEKSDPDEEMCEIYRQLSIVKCTLKSVGDLLEKIEMENGPSIFYVSDHLSELELNCVYKCYEEQKLEALNILRRDIRGGLRLLMEYLRRKEEELKQRREIGKRKLMGNSLHENCANPFKKKENCAN